MSDESEARLSATSREPQGFVRVWFHGYGVQEAQRTELRRYPFQTTYFRLGIVVMDDTVLVLTKGNPCYETRFTSGGTRVMRASSALYIAFAIRMCRAYEARIAFATRMSRI
jgi:hypothetical protein